MYYETEGPKNGIPMLMLHGFGCQLELMRGCMEPAIEAAGMKDKVLRAYVDLPGHGRSNEAPISLATSDAILKETLAVMDKIAPDGEFAVVGQSYGGYRFNPAAPEGKKFSLDSKEPAGGYQEFLMNEARYSRLTREFPERAQELFKENEEAAMARYQHLLKLKAMYADA